MQAVNQPQLSTSHTTTTTSISLTGLRLFCLTGLLFQGHSRLGQVTPG